MPISSVAHAFIQYAKTRVATLRKWIVLVLFIGLIALGLATTFLPMGSPTNQSGGGAPASSENHLSQATLQR